jgi:hypothetical protein
VRLGRSGRRLCAAGACALGILAYLAPTAGALPDNRGWELVSPVDKNGGEIAAPGELAGGGVLQAAADGQSVTYGSAASFGPDAQGAPPGSQYLATRGGGWLTQNISLPLDSGAFGPDPDGVPYRLFSTDLARALHWNAHRCEAGDPCPRDYFLRETATGALALSPSEPDLVFAGASPDLRQLVLSTCAALTAGATEVPLGEGCDPAKPNLYLWSGGSPTLVNGVPGAALAAQGGAVSADGSRVYWSDLASGNLFLKDGAQTKQVDAAAGGGGTFQTASADGSVAFYTKAGHLWRYLTSTAGATDLTPSGGVSGVLGASADGSYLYFQEASGLKLWHAGVTTSVALGAAAADPGNYPPTVGTARVSSDGTKLLFVSLASLTAYNNLDQKTGLPDSQVFLYEAGPAQLRCLSCRANGTRPIGASTIPGALANGAGPTATNPYKPRVLTLEGHRVFFDTRDALAGSDTNADADVYQWEANGTGTCAKAAGCVDLISSGRSEEGASFVDASSDGDNAFFLTDGSLVGWDPGSVDLYDARVGGGFADPLAPIPCLGDSCQSLPPEPVDPALSTLFVGPGNPPVRYRRYRRPNHDRCRRSAKKRSKRASGVADQLGDHLLDGGSALGGQLRQPARVLAADADQDRHLCVGAAFVDLDIPRITWVDRFQEGVEIAGLGIGVCPGVRGHDSASQHLTLAISRVPTGDDKPGAGLQGLLDHQGQRTAPVREADKQTTLSAPARVRGARVAVSRQLPHLPPGDATRAQLLDRRHAHQQLMDYNGHGSSPLASIAALKAGATLDSPPSGQWGGTRARHDASCGGRR